MFQPSATPTELMLSTPVLANLRFVENFEQFSTLRNPSRSQRTDAAQNVCLVLLTKSE